MAKELKHEASLVRMRLARRDFSLDDVQKLFALASTTIPGEVRAKYLRDQRISSVTADVSVQAKGERGLAVYAVVHVKITYRGDIVRSSPLIRNRINHRLQAVASKAAMQAVFNEVVSRGGKA